MLGYTSNQFQFRLLAWSELFNKAAYFRDFQNQQLEPSEIFSVHMAENHAMGRFYILVQGWIQAMLGIPTCTFWTNCFSTGEAFWMFRIRFPAFLKMEYLEKPNQKMWEPDSANKFLYWYSCWILPKKFPSAGINSSIFIGRNTPPKSIPNGYLWKRDEIFEWNVSSSNYHFVSKRDMFNFSGCWGFFFLEHVVACCGWGTAQGDRLIALGHRGGKVSLWQFQASGGCWVGRSSLDTFRSSLERVVDINNFPTCEQWKKKGPWLVGWYKGWQTTQVYRDYFINHEIRIPINHPV